VIHTPLGQNGLLKLAAKCSILDYKAKDFIPAAKNKLVENIRVSSLPVALLRVPEAFFSTYAQDAHAMRPYKQQKVRLVAGLTFCCQV